MTAKASGSKRVINATGETTIFVYSAGKLIAEYSTASLPTVGKINYTTTDHLGSPRVITDQSGQVTSRRDFLPFGEDISIGIGGRTGDGGQSYSSSTDKIRQKFTGYQKDTETSLDFAEARMYENRFGRFTAVDPLLASGKSTNPQTFNRFNYVGNNPIVTTDPLGLDWYQQLVNGRYQYRWFDKDAEKGWDPVDFGRPGNVWRKLDNDFCGGGVCNNGPGFLYKYGGWDWGQRAASMENQNIFFAGFSDLDPKQIAVRSDQVRSAASDVMWMGAAVANKPSETYNFAAWGANKLGANLPYAPTIDPDENTRSGGKLFYYGLNAGLAAQGGASLLNSVRSGINGFRSGGTTFAERLFNSKTFGKESALFGNSQYGSAGLLNKPGSMVKAGWSGGRQEMNFLNPRYANGLVLDAKTMARSSFTGGGRQFRLTFGSNGNKGMGHVYIPRTFVPDSIANIP